MKPLALILAAGSVGCILLPQPTASHRVPVSTVAPEVCELDGHVDYVNARDKLLYVHCSDGLIKLVTK